MSTPAVTAADVAEIKDQLHKLTAMVARLGNRSGPATVMRAGATLVRGSVACQRLALTMRSLNRLVADDVFTDARSDGGWRLVYADELDAAIAEPDPVRRREAVRQVRIQKGRLRNK